MFEDDKLTNLESQLKVIRLFPSFISLEDKESFSSPITLKEVEKALHLFKKDKARGRMDGHLSSTCSLLIFWALS